MHEGIAAAQRVFGRLKIDTVVIRGVNDDEMCDLIEYGKAMDAEVRFIEYMDVGGATQWSPAPSSRGRRCSQRSPPTTGAWRRSSRRVSAPADRFALPDGTTFGIISSTTEPFCSSCDRSRLTADGMWYLCLYAARGIDLRAPLRRGASGADIAAHHPRRLARSAAIAAPKSASRWATAARSCRSHR